MSAFYFAVLWVYVLAREGEAVLAPVEQWE
jgi:hypothetical protein